MRTRYQRWRVVHSLSSCVMIGSELLGVGASSKTKPS